MKRYLLTVQLDVCDDRIGINELNWMLPLRVNLNDGIKVNMTDAVFEEQPTLDESIEKLEAELKELKDQRRVKIERDFDFDPRSYHPERYYPEILSR
ncbi:MAG TPA: hypothetical protein VMW36_02115 [Patescibacteria group bacterium]|nr:hypothetical protein [Patescibacteria group bacterium]